MWTLGVFGVLLPVPSWQDRAVNLGEGRGSHTSLVFGETWGAFAVSQHLEPGHGVGDRVSGSGIRPLPGELLAQGPAG